MTNTRRTTRSMTKAKASTTAARAKRRVQKEAVSLSEHRERIAALKGVAEIIYETQKDKGAVGNTRRGYGLVRKYYNKYKSLYPWMEYANLHWHLRQLRQPEDINAPPRIPSSGSERSSVETLPSSSSSDAEDNDSLSRKKGRPKGSSVQKKHDEKKRFINATNYVAETFNEWKEKCDGKDGRAHKVPRGTLANIIKEAREKFNLPKSYEIKERTIRSRVNRKHLHAVHRGKESPMTEVEELLVEIALQKDSMNQPITASEGLMLANSLIEGTELEDRVKAYYRERKFFDNEDKYCAKKDGEEQKSILRQGYWCGFMRRHGHRIVTKKGRKFTKDRSAWCHYSNFVKMYNLVYKAMESAGVAIRLDKPKWMNEKGEVVSDQFKAIGLECTHKLIHPEYVLFADEVGCNTNQKDDGNYGGEKRLTKRGSTPKQMCSSSDAHWTLLGFTDATGQPVMCGIIFKGDSLTPEERLGFDIFAPVVEPADCVSSNFGPGKRFPGPPKCVVRGVEVPAYVACSEKGSITSTILKGMLERLDSLNIFPRGPDKPLPFLLVDGHGSRLELPFIEYINDPAHKWKVCLGLPYGTSFWQVGDSSEQNGSYKMETYRYKDMLLKKNGNEHEKHQYQTK